MAISNSRGTEPYYVEAPLQECIGRRKYTSPSELSCDNWLCRPTWRFEGSNEESRLGPLVEPRKAWWHRQTTAVKCTSDQIIIAPQPLPIETPMDQIKFREHVRQAVIQ